MIIFCGFWETCDYYGSLKECEKYSPGLTFKEINSTLIESEQTCRVTTIRDRCLKASNESHLTYEPCGFITNFFSCNWPAKTGKEFTGPKYFVTESMSKQDIEKVEVVVYAALALVVIVCSWIARRVVEHTE